jgi:GT2 family glycosyltransferase
VGAVTGAFLACRRGDFARVGPFDEHTLGATFNDVDFCLRLRAAGLAVLYAPEIALVHFESKSRGIDDLDAAKRERAAFERRKLLERWGDAVLLDPGFNPHWSRWTRPFAAIREPSPAEIEAHLAASASANPWNPMLRAVGGEEA